MALGAELQPSHPGHMLCVWVSLATPSPDHSQLFQLRERPLGMGEYELRKVDVVIFKELSPPGEVQVEELSKSCPRQEEGLVQTVSPHSHHWTGEWPVHIPSS